MTRFDLIFGIILTFFGGVLFIGNMILWRFVPATFGAVVTGIGYYLVLKYYTQKYGK